MFWDRWRLAGKTDQQRAGGTPALPGGKRMMATHRSEFRLQAATISCEPKTA
jgi:hypothetical protein